jgi:hypothetical protein
MPRRSGGLSGRPGVRFTYQALALVAAAAGCQSSNTGTAGCGVEQQLTLDASPLTLMSGARLDRVVGTFALSGVEPDGKMVRWRSLDEAGVAGPEQQLTVPPAPGGPWLAFTGDTLLVAQGFGAANGADVELRVVTVPATGAATTPAAGPVLATIPGALKGAPSPGVAIGASRTGGHATLAWYDQTAAGVQTLTVTAAGAAVGKPSVVEPSTPASCLAFASGRDAATLTFYRPIPGKDDPELVIIELDETGARTGTLQLELASHATAGCAQVRATAQGYLIAFEDTQGGWLGVYSATNGLLLTPFSAAVSFPGGRQPPVVGLATAPEGYAVVVQGAHGGELWRLDADGYRLPGTLYFPSAEGRTGEVSTWTGPGGAVWATYADYTKTTDAGTNAEGQRFLVRAGCL